MRRDVDLLVVFLCAVSMTEGLSNEPAATETDTYASVGSVRGV